MQKLLPLAFSLCVLSSPAKAEFVDGNTLLSRINGNDIEQFHALGYITGVVDALMGSVICPPPNITARQVNDMVLSFLKASPGVRHKSADAIVSHVTSLAWPCETKKKGTGT